jgi:hypothetical protein
MERVTDEEAGNGGWFWNEQVGSYRPPGSLYCRECGVLIQDYDHLYVYYVLCLFTQLFLLRLNVCMFDFIHYDRTLTHKNNNVFLYLLDILIFYRCPWTGTGVGRRNMMAFKLFVVGVNVLCYFSIILVIVALLRGLRVPAT